VGACCARIFHLLGRTVVAEGYHRQKPLLVKTILLMRFRLEWPLGHDFTQVGDLAGEVKSISGDCLPHLEDQNVSTEIALPGPEVPVIDESRLMAEFGGDEEILAELRDLFLEHAPPLYIAIKQAMVDQDMAVIARDGHSLKGACATYGAPRLAMVCKVIELAAKAGDWETINARSKIFEVEYEQVFNAIGNLSGC